MSGSDGEDLVQVIHVRRIGGALLDVDRGALPDGGGCCCAMRIRRTAGGCAKRDENNTDHCEWRSLNHYLRPLPLMTDDRSARLRPRVTPVRCDSCNCSSVAVMRAPHPSRRSASPSRPRLCAYRSRRTSGTSAQGSGNEPIPGTGITDESTATAPTRQDFDDAPRASPDRPRRERGHRLI